MPHRPVPPIRARQSALILHGGRYGLYDVYRIHNPDESPEAWRWEKVAFLGPEEVRERIMGDFRCGPGFDSLYRPVGPIPTLTLVANYPASPE